MSKQLKSLIADALKTRYEGVDEACAVDITALNVHETMRVRRALTKRNMRVSVVKNSLARRAFRGGPLEPLSADLSGPCALVTGGESAIEVARALVKLAEEFPKITLKRGQVSGDSELMSVAALAKMRGRMEILGELAALIGGPGRRIASCLGSPQSKIAGCVKKLAERGE